MFELTVNVAKNNVVVFKRCRKDENFNFCHYGEEKINVVKVYKYLDVNFSSSCVFRKHSDITEKRLNYLVFQH